MFYFVTGRLLVVLILSALFFVYTVFRKKGSHQTFGNYFLKS